MTSFVGHTPVNPRDTDRYGRTVADITLSDGRDLGELVGRGMAWWYRTYAPDDRVLERLEAEAARRSRALGSSPADSALGMAIGPGDSRDRWRGRQQTVEAVPRPVLPRGRRDEGREPGGVRLEGRGRAGGISEGEGLPVMTQDGAGGSPTFDVVGLKSDVSGGSCAGACQVIGRTGERR